MPSHPMGLRVSYDGTSAILTWQPDPGASAGYVVYRSSLPPSLDTLADAVELASLGPEALEYAEDSPPQGAWYYFILSQGEDGQVLPVFEVAKNSTRRPLEIPARPAAMEAPTATPPPSMAPAASPAPVVQSAPAPVIVAPAPTAPPPAASTAIATAPASPKPLAPAPSLSPSPAKLPSANLPLKPLAPSLKPNLEAKPGPVAIDQRESPLPSYLYPGIASPLEARPKIGPSDIDLSPEIQDAIYRLLDGEGQESPGMPDLVAPVGAEGKEWATLRKALADGDWATVKTGAARMAKGKDPNLARWFLGVGLVGLGKYREGLYELIPSADIYPRETKPWIDYALRALSQGEG